MSVPNPTYVTLRNMPPTTSADRGLVPTPMEALNVPAPWVPLATPLCASPYPPPSASQEVTSARAVVAWSATTRHGASEAARRAMRTPERYHGGSALHQGIRLLRRRSSAPLARDA